MPYYIYYFNALYDNTHHKISCCCHGHKQLKQFFFFFGGGVWNNTDTNNTNIPSLNKHQLSQILLITPCCQPELRNNMMMAWAPLGHNIIIFYFQLKDTFAKLLKTDACLLLLCNKNNNIIYARYSNCISKIILYSITTSLI